MTGEQLLVERAQLLLGEAGRQGRQPTMHHLEEIASKSLPDLSAEDRREAVMAALRHVNRMESVAPPPGYRPSQKRNGTEPPKRAPSPVAARKIETSSESDWTPARLREFTRGRLKADPKLTAAALYEEAKKLGNVTVTYTTFATSYHNDARRELGLTSPGNRPIQVPSAEQSKEIDPISSTEAPPPVAVDPSHSVAPVELPNCAIPQPNTQTAYAPGSIELGGGEDSFKATRRQDGGWDVELRAQVDTEVMDMLAGVIYRRVVGRAMEASS